MTTQDDLLPVGLEDALPARARTITSAMRAVLDAMDAHGYDRVRPPLVEFEKSLGHRMDGLQTRAMFRFVDPASLRTLALRSDITPQIGRIAATALAARTRPLRLCYAGEVARISADQLDPVRQRLQVGAELIGSDSIAAASEIVLTAITALEKVGIGSISVDFTLPDLVDTLAERAHPMDAETVDAVRAVVAQHQETWPETVHVRYLQDESEQVVSMLTDLENNVISAIVLVMIVIVVIIMVVVVVMTVVMLYAVPVRRPMGVTIGMLVRQQAILAILTAVGQAHIAAISDPAQPQRRGLGLVVSPFLRGRRTGNVVGVSLALGTLDARRKLARAQGQADCAGALIGNGVAAQVNLTLIAALGNVGRYATVDQVDHPTNGTAAIQQGRRPFQHLNPLQQRGIGGHRMVRADSRGIHHVCPIAQHPYPRPIQAADHRAAGAWPEVAGLYTRQRLKAVCQPGLALIDPLVPLQHGGRLGHAIGGLFQCRSTDSDTG